ncbi:MAG: hypothetical protein Ct9H300mP32_3060 [Verrucomicrobiota bacterium]|nr:MAG: hypothetical protein Ct9H300mP32_3060 [Verrucomicrobiota bacterium]
MHFSGCWIESCFHEGLALSGADKIVRVLDSVIINWGRPSRSDTSPERHLDAASSPVTESEPALAIIMTAPISVFFL